MSKPVFAEIVKITLTALVGGWIALRYTGAQKRADARREFRSVIAKTMANRNLVWSGPPTLSDLHSSHELQEACIKVRPDIPFYKRLSFDATYRMLYGPGSECWGLPLRSINETENQAIQRNYRDGKEAIETLLYCAK